MFITVKLLPIRFLCNTKSCVYLFVTFLNNLRPINKLSIMESNYYQITMRKDNQLLVITHLCQLLTAFTGFGGLVVPLILWLTQKDSVQGMNAHGKAIVNFQLSIIVYSIISVVLILIGIGILMLIAIGIFAFILPIINAIKAGNGELPSYPLSLKFIS